MNENTANNTTILNQDSTAEEYTKILRGRYITNITLTDMDNDGYALTATLTLDNDTTLTVEANEGCGGCANGWYHITRAFYRGNRCARIMNARVEYTRNENDIRDGWEKYTIFVMIRAEMKPSCPSSPHKATTDPAHTAPASPSQHARPRTSRDKATQLTTNKKANAHAQNYIPTVTAANMLPILEAHVGPVRRLSITGADHTAFAINSSFEPIIAHFTYDPDSPLYYTVEQVATIHNGLTPHHIRYATTMVRRTSTLVHRRHEKHETTRLLDHARRNRHDPHA